jgi:hypothetical protein
MAARPHRLSRAADRRPTAAPANFAAPKPPRSIPHVALYLPVQTRAETEPGNVLWREVRRAAAATASPPVPRHRSRAVPTRQRYPRRRIEIPRLKTDRDPSQTNLSTSQLWSFCSSNLEFPRNQPAVLPSSKVIAFRSFLFCFGPCSFPK